MSFVASEHRKYYAGVALDREVTAYVDRIANGMDWSRSITLNFMVREQARRHGDDVVLPALKRMLREEVNSN